MPVNGTDLVNTQFDLSVGSTAQIELSGAIDPGAGFVELQAQATVAGLTVFNPDDDLALLNERSGPEEIFADSFE
mgnify:CR=1 FL=1